MKTPILWNTLCHSGAFPGIKILIVFSDFRVFPNFQDHSWDQCKFEEKLFMGVGVWTNLHFCKLSSNQILTVAEAPRAFQSFQQKPVLIPDFTLVRLGVQLSKSWAEPELSLLCEQGSARIISAGSGFLIRDAGCSHYSGSDRAHLGIRAEPRQEPVWKKTQH